MRAVVFHRPKHVSVEQQPDPRIDQGCDDIISHRVGLDEAPRAYELFNNKGDRCTKVVIDPWR